MLPEVRIEEAVYPFLGEGKTIADVERARVALEQAYRDAGYLTVLVDIPEQSVNGGVVQLKVVEGSIEKVRVTGSRYFDRDRILSRVPELAQGSVPYFPAVQRQLADANQMADLKVTPLLSPGKNRGTVEAELRVEDKLPAHASVELNNYASANTTSTRLVGQVRYDNLWQRGHSLSMQAQTTPQNTSQVKVFSGTYSMPMRGNQLALYAVVSRSMVPIQTDMTMVGHGNILGARYVMPLRGGEKLFHNLALGVDYKDFKDDSFLAGANTGHTPISYLPFSLAYNATLLHEDSVTQANVAANFHLRGVGDKMTICNGQVVSQFECKRFNAQANYFYLRGGVDHTLNLTSGMSLFGRVDGQIASGPLVSNEQFTAGGADSVRGYYESEQAGDDGLHGSVELRSPQWAKNNVNDLHALAFVDAAHLRVREPLPAQTARFDLSSVGLGLRLQAWNDFILRLDLAWPLKTTVSTPGGKPHLSVKTSLSL